MVEQFVELLGMAPTSIDGGELKFVRGSLCATLSIWKGRYERSLFGWMAHTGYCGLGDRMDGFGGLGIRIGHPSPSRDAGSTDPPPPPCYAWPAGSAPLASEVSASVTYYGPPSLRFVRDSHDLGRLLLLGDTHVHRGGVWPSAPANNEQGRLAKAILLARQRGDQDLEGGSRQAVEPRREPVAGRPDYLFRQAVADWSRQYAKATGIDLSDLAKLKRKRPQYPEIP